MNDLDASVSKPITQRSSFSAATDCAEELNENVLGPLLFSGARGTLIDACVFLAMEATKLRFFFVGANVELLVTRFIVGSFNILALECLDSPSWLGECVCHSGRCGHVLI